jgi:hypothetical protein
LDNSINGIVAIVGNYGSGKTEVAINLAVSRKRSGLEVRIADLDLVNPYFRTREARDTLEALGIKVILPAREFMHADLPILSPAIAGMIRQPDGLTLLDVGGDDAGATVLAALGDAFAGLNVHMLQVVNPLRPQTAAVEGCLRIKDEIETASKLTVSGLIGNANLIDETGVSEIVDGYNFLLELSEASGLPLAFITVATRLLEVIDIQEFSCPVLPIARQLVPPWKAAADFSDLKV